MIARPMVWRIELGGYRIRTVSQSRQGSAAHRCRWRPDGRLPAKGSVVGGASLRRYRASLRRDSTERVVLVPDTVGPGDAPR